MSHKQPSFRYSRSPTTELQNLFDHNQRLETSHSRVAELLHRLDLGTNTDEVLEAGAKISSMEGILGQFSETQFELQQEINEILESSRKGLLTHEKLSDMIAMEQTRSNFVNGIVNSLKQQIESLFHVITETISNPNDDGQAMVALQNEVGMMLKSVDSLNTVIYSPAKKLDMTIKRIDSELVVHLNDQYAHNQGGAGTSYLNMGRSNLMAKVGGGNNNNKSGLSQMSNNKKNVGLKAPNFSHQELMSSDEDSDDNAKQKPIKEKKKQKPRLDNSDDDVEDEEKDANSPSSSRRNSVNNEKTTTKGTTDKFTEKPKLSAPVGKKEDASESTKIASAAVEEAGKAVSTVGDGAAPSSVVVSEEGANDQDSVAAATDNGPRKKKGKKLKDKKDKTSGSGSSNNSNNKKERSSSIVSAGDGSVGTVGTMGSVERQKKSNEDSPSSSYVAKRHGSGSHDSTASVELQFATQNAGKSSLTGASGGNPGGSDNGGYKQGYDVGFNAGLALAAQQAHAQQKAQNAAALAGTSPSGNSSTANLLSTAVQNNSNSNNNNAHVRSNESSLPVTPTPLPAGTRVFDDSPTGTPSMSPAVGGVSVRKPVATKAVKIADGINSRTSPAVFASDNNSGATTSTASSAADQHAASILADITMTNREKALTERENDLKRQMAANEEVIQKRVSEALEAKRQFERRVQASLAAAGYVSKEELAPLLLASNATAKDKASALLMRSKVKLNSRGHDPADGDVDLSADDTPMTIEMIFEDREILEMMLLNNPTLSADALIQDIQELFHNCENTNDIIQARLMSLMTGTEITVTELNTNRSNHSSRPGSRHNLKKGTQHTRMQISDSFDANDEDVTAMFGKNKSLASIESGGGSATGGGNRSIAVVDAAKGGGGAATKETSSTERGRGGTNNKKGKDKNHKSRRPNQPPSNSDDGDCADSGTDNHGYSDSNNDGNNRVFAEARNANNATADWRQEREIAKLANDPHTGELYSTIFASKNSNRRSFINIETIKIVAPYNRDQVNATEKETSTDDLSSFVDGTMSMTKPHSAGNTSGETEQAATPQTDKNASNPSSEAAVADRKDENLDYDPAVHGSRPSTAALAIAAAREAGMMAGTVDTPFNGEKELSNLRIYDNRGPDLLITRTYKPSPHIKSFLEYLQESQNPLFTLYSEYQHLFSDVERIRLASIAINESKINKEFASNSALRQLITILHTNIVNIAKECDRMLHGIEAVEDIVSNLVALLKVSSKDAVQIISNSVQVHDLYKHYGEIEGTKITVDLQMHEYRGLFERINAVSQHALANLLAESTELNTCYKYYVSCQGKTLEVHQRLISCKERCVRYKIIQHVHTAMRSNPNNNNNNSNNHLNSMSVGGVNNASSSVYPPTNSNNNNNNSNNNRSNDPNDPNQHQQQFNPTASGFYSNNSQYLEDNIYTLYSQLQEENDNLKSDLEVADEDIADLEQELQELIAARDRSPSALLFFTLLSDPSYVTNLQQLLLQLNSLKPFADGHVSHIDFVTLRKRIQVCIICLPGIDRMLNYYSQTHTKWTQYRNNWFASRNVTGGAADGLQTCPLCYHSLHTKSNTMEGAVLVSHGSPLRIRASRGGGGTQSGQSESGKHQQQYGRRQKNGMGVGGGGSGRVMVGSKSVQQLGSTGKQFSDTLPHIV